MRSRRQKGFSLLGGVTLWLWLLPAVSLAENDIATARVTFVDETRPTKASGPFAGSRSRRLDTLVWFPAEGEAVAAGGPYPLILYSHGTYGRPDNATHFCEDLARNGYIVAAPAFPLTSSVSHTKLPSADVSDAGRQPGDVSFVIDSLLAHPRFGEAIDADRIGATGISLGGITTYFASFGHPTRDPRIKASAPIAAGDPAYAALAFGLGFEGVAPAPVNVPALLLVADADVFAAVTGGSEASYVRLRAPRYMVEIHDAPHVWFGDRDHVPEDDVNPDCLWFQANTGHQPPICAERRKLIDPAAQKAIVRDALRNFFDGYLKEDADARSRLANIAERLDGITLESDPSPQP